MTKAERWADDYLRNRDECVTRYGLKTKIGDSILAAMFEKFATETPTRNLCPECDYNREISRVKREIAVEMTKARLQAFSDENKDAIERLTRDAEAEASVAQTVEQGTCNAEVGGSNPSAGSTIRTSTVQVEADEWESSVEEPTRPRNQPRNRRCSGRMSDFFRAVEICLGKKAHSGESVNGKPTDSKPVTEGSSPSSPATEDDFNLWGV